MRNLLAEIYEVNERIMTGDICSAKSALASTNLKKILTHYHEALHEDGAVKAYADKADRDILRQKAVIANLQADIGMLRQRIADQNDAIISGKAIIPDAKPYHGTSERDQDKPHTRADDLRISE